MPPKIRRPAAALPAPARRPARAPRRREEEAWLKAKDCRLEDFPAGQTVVVEGEYWEGAADLCGEVVGGVIEGEQRYLKLRGTGTHSENILKYLSGVSSRLCEVHLCGDPCGARVWRDGLVHANKIKRIEGGREAWMDNLQAAPKETLEEEEDVNEELRKEAEKARLELMRREKAEDAPGKGAEGKRKKKKKSGKRLKASDGKKAVATVFSGTGLDPDPGVRKLAIKAAKKVRKKGKKKRRRSSSSATSSSATSSSASSEEVMGTEIFQGQRENLKLWKKVPGALSLSTIVEAQQSLLTRQGIQPDVSTAELPALMVQYYRSSLQPTMSPALSRESHHWASLIDLLVQGDVARACDLACQRLKALESYSRGVTLEIARQLELIPAERPSLASQTETQQAGRLALEEQKVAQKTRFAGKGLDATPGFYKGGKGKTKGDGKRSKGDSKGGKKGKEEEKDRAS